MFLSSGETGFHISASQQAIGELEKGYAQLPCRIYRTDGSSREFNYWRFGSVLGRSR